jgi:pyridoxine 5'-phosphate synthase PdxJ
MTWNWNWRQYRYVASARQQRGTRYPDPVHAALIAEQAAPTISLPARGPPYPEA